MTAVSHNTLRRRCRGISAGIFAAPLAALGAAVEDLARWGAGPVHFDIMDGVFVPQITGGPAFVAALGAGMVRDVHLMVADPSAHIDAFADAGADIITVHAESDTAIDALAAIRRAETRLARPILAGLAVMPSTALDTLGPLLAAAPDLLLVLALDPRSTTPADLETAGARLERLREMTAATRPILAIDGGVTKATVATAAACRPDIIVSGSAIFGAAEPEVALSQLTRVWAATAASEPEAQDAG